MGRFDLTDRQWERLEPLLPPERPRTGRPNDDHRRIVNGILWVLRTGAPWRDLPERYGPWRTVYARFARWQRDGTWDRLLAHVQTKSDAVGEVVWEVSIDSTAVRAHQHAAGARKKGAVARPRWRATRRWGAAAADGQRNCTWPATARGGRCRSC
jgi:transposase